MLEAGLASMEGRFYGIKDFRNDWHNLYRNYTRIRKDFETDLRDCIIRRKSWESVGQRAALLIHKAQISLSLVYSGLCDAQVTYVKEKLNEEAAK